MRGIQGSRSPLFSFTSHRPRCFRGRWRFLLGTVSFTFFFLYILLNYSLSICVLCEDSIDPFFDIDLVSVARMGESRDHIFDPGDLPLRFGIG